MKAFIRVVLMTLLVSLALVPTSQAHAKCALTWLGVHLVTPQDQPLPIDASIVAAEGSTREGTPPRRVLLKNRNNEATTDDPLL